MRCNHLIVAPIKTRVKKYNLDDFLEVSNEEDIPDQPEDESKGPARANIIRNEDDDELEPPAPDSDADEDLDEDDYGTEILYTTNIRGGLL